MRKFKLNLLLSSSIVFIGFVIISMDSYSLNSLIIDYEEDFVIDEVNVLEEKDTIVEVNDTNKVQLVSRNNVGDLNRWVFPVQGNYLITTYYSYSHKAIDIYSYSGLGSPILSANNGTVSMSVSGCSVGDLSCNGRRGNYVVINHNSGNYYTVYMHLKDIYVNVGDTVEAGQTIGSMGNTGYVIPTPTSSNPYGGTHLHFCVYIGEPDRGGYAINPFDLY